MIAKCRRLLPFGMIPMLFLSLGCQSSSHADRGAVLGGLLGAGTGAVVGDALGNAGAGTAIGAGVGALSGAAIGNAVDESEARNRAEIARQLGRKVSAGAVSVDDVVAMTAAGVSEELIINHVRNNGMIAPLKTNDIILLQQQGVSTRVIAAMQETPQPAQATVVQESTPVIVEEHHYGPYCGPRYYHRPPPYCPPRSGVSWGFSISD